MVRKTPQPRREVLGCVRKRGGVKKQGGVVKTIRVNFRKQCFCSNKNETAAEESAFW